MRQYSQRGWLIRLFAWILSLLVPRRWFLIRKPPTGLWLRLAEPGAKPEAGDDVTQTWPSIEGNWRVINVTALSPAVTIPVQWRCPEAQVLNVVIEPQRPTIGEVSDLDLISPQIRSVPVLPLPGEITDIPVEPFEIPLIVGRIRRWGSFSAGERTRQPSTATSAKSDGPRPEPLIPVALWDQIWRILSAPAQIEEIVSEKYPGQLRPYQVDGVRQLIEKERFILADEMGTGKTVQVCVALSLLVRLGRIRRILIVCPKTVLTVWTNHLRDWAPEIIVHLYDYAYPPRAMANDTRAHAWVITYPRIGAQFDAVNYWGTKWDVGVLDEVHEIRNSNTKRYKHLEVIVSQARYRWGLSGTPLQNQLEELTNIFRIVVPELKLQAETLQPNEVRERIRPYMRRVSRKTALPDLPPKKRVEIWLELDPEQARAYEAIVRDAARRVPTDDRTAFTHIWQVLMELKQICNFAPGASSSPKTQKLVELTEDITQKGEKVVVFTQFRHCGIDRIIPHLGRFGLAVIHGGCSDAERSSAIQRFQNDPHCRVILGTVRTAGFGLTLTAANHVIHFDHWWNPAVAWQAEDRVYRIGQTRPVTVYEFWMKGTVEERVRQILQEKGLLHQEIIERLSDTEFKKLFTLEELLALLELRPSFPGARRVGVRPQETGTARL